MVDEIVENIYLVNAPAGSGKTTTIKSMIVNHTINFTKDNILCITYTNRAANELKKDLSNDKVYIATIHSFINKFIKIYFKHKEIIELYFEIYGDEIKERIDNKENKDNITKSNEKYRDKNGDLNYEVIKKNINYLSYNELSFNSLYYGGLSHDDLISFTKTIFDKFPIIKKRLAQKYQVIFVDEYQDSSANVLNIFYEAVYGTSTKLYFLGDKMQQIYKNYDGSFEARLNTLNKSIALDTNHRSVPNIIDILNNIYNDETRMQNPSVQNIYKVPKHSPRVIISENVDESLNLECLLYPEALVLFLLNRQRFTSIGISNLYNSLNRMDKYNHIQKHSAVDVLIDNTLENPDSLIKLLFIIDQVHKSFVNNNLGGIIQILNKNPIIFDKAICTVNKHGDKERLSECLNLILDKYRTSTQQHDINAVLSDLKQNKLVRSEYVDEIMNSEEYSEVLKVNIEEFKKLVEYLNNPNISTQHGVKGESHDTVFFIADNSTSSPIVHMYKFFEFWSSNDISLQSFEDFYYSYLTKIYETHEVLGVKISELKKKLYDEHQVYLEGRTKELIEEFKNNNIFNSLCLPKYEKYLEHTTMTNLKDCFKESTVYGVLSAYRLFYVGCSRAKSNLTVFIDKEKIKEFEDRLVVKLAAVGFEIRQ